MDSIPQKKTKWQLKLFSEGATRLILSICNLTYYERLKILKLPTLEYSRKRERMIEVYTILNCVYDLTVTEGIFTINERNSRGNTWVKIGNKKATNLFFFKFL